MSGGSFQDVLARLRSASRCANAHVQVRRRDLEHLLERHSRVAGELANLKRLAGPQARDIGRSRRHQRCACGGNRQVCAEPDCPQR